MEECKPLPRSSWRRLSSATRRWFSRSSCFTRAQGPAHTEVRSQSSTAARTLWSRGSSNAAEAVSARRLTAWAERRATLCSAASQASARRHVTGRVLAASQGDACRATGGGAPHITGWRLLKGESRPGKHLDWPCPDKRDVVGARRLDAREALLALRDLRRAPGSLTTSTRTDIGRARTTYLTFRVRSMRTLLRQGEVRRVVERKHSNRCRSWTFY